MIRNCTTSISHRNGSLISELVICTVVMGVVAAVLIPSVVAVGRQRQAVRFETHALIELNGLAARLKSHPNETPTLSESFGARYPQAELTVGERESQSSEFRLIELSLAPSESRRNTKTFEVTVVLPVGGEE